MKPSELAQSLADIVIGMQHPALVVGPPGVGKSAVVAQAAAAAGGSLIDVRAAYFDPVDVRGFPMPDAERAFVRWLMPRFFRDAIDQAPAVLFFDELPNAPISVQNVLYQLFLDRRIDEHVLPDDCAVIAAGNRAENRSGAFRISTALANRLLHYTLDVDLNDWCTWALQNGIPVELVAFIRWRPEPLMAFDPRSSDFAFPSPRMWGARVGPMLAAAVGHGAAVELVGFLRVWHQLPSPDAAIMDPRNADVPNDPAVKFALAGAIAKRADDANFGFKLPEGAIVERQYQGLSAEDIYARKMAEQPPPQDQDGGQQQTRDVGDQDGAGDSEPPGLTGGDQLPDCGGMGWVCDLPGQGGAQPGPAEIVQANEDVDVLLAQAAALAKARGELPAHMARQIEQELYPQRDRWDLLRQYMLDHARNDYAWVPPNQRMLCHGFVLPGARSNEMDTMVVAIDTSGSIGQAELDVFAACVQGAIDAIQPLRVIAVYCDSEVQRVDEFSMGQPVEFEAIGGGGTKFQPVFDQLEADGIVPACLVYLTDGDCWDTPQNPGYPVVWACTTDKQQAFGEHIRITM